MDKKTNIKDIISMAGGLDYINPKDIPSANNIHGGSAWQE